jgi:pSer/pThr/pTyr-binding forkhead associated (FHA) protein
MKNYIRIGRGNDNDLRLNDISVSRVHAFIKRDRDGSFFIEDNTSKFGTLVQIQKPLQLSDKLTYYFQSGRTIFKAQVEKEQNFWERLMTSKDQDK